MDHQHITKQNFFDKRLLLSCKEEKLAIFLYTNTKGLNKAGLTDVTCFFGILGFD